MLKQRLAQKLQQKLSPQQIQLMKLLQVPTASLDQRVKEELEANPALEAGMESQSADDDYEDSLREQEQEERTEEDFDLSDYIDDDEVPDYKTRDSNYPDPEEERNVPVKVNKSFHEYLLQQLGMVELDDRQFLIAEQVIGSISDDGYLRRELIAIVDDLAFAQNIETNEEELQQILKVVQDFEPAGIGARDLQECLLLQLERKIEDESDAEEEVVTALKILRDYFEEFVKKHYSKLQRTLKIEEDELKAAIDEILKLNPKPGSSFGGSTKVQQYIIPDFIIEYREGELELRLNARNAPELRVSGDFKNMLQGYKESKTKDKEKKQAVLFIKQKIDAAKWFIDAIRQRQQTLLNTMHAIMDYQYGFFISGDETKLRPMILKDIAEMIQMDISTVSRVANSKYVQTEFGIYPLKYFFSESLTTDTGEEVSTREVKNILNDLIEKEEKKKPLSDQKLMEELKEKGYNIARRTVAKYREQLNIPVARLRKEL